MELTAAGLFGIFTRFPFDPFLPTGEHWNRCGCKGSRFFRVGAYPYDKKVNIRKFMSPSRARYPTIPSEK
jgi:hypothetical protein